MMEVKRWEIECETNVEKRWFEVEAVDEDHAVERLYDLVPDIEEIIEVTEVNE